MFCACLVVSRWSEQFGPNQMDLFGISAKSLDRDFESIRRGWQDGANIESTIYGLSDRRYKRLDAERSITC
jgi:hypothetical protein